MADHDRDENLSRRYRELAREEPPRALDDAILAAARREVESRPAPLVAPTGRRRWFVPVAAAAVIVLSAVVTLHVQQEQSDPELSGPQVATAPRARKDDAPTAAPPAQLREEQVAAPRAKEADAMGVPAEAAKPQSERRQRQAPAAKPAAPSQPAFGESAPAIARSEPKAAAESERFSQDPAPVAAAPAPPAAATQMRPAAPAAPAPRAADSAAGSGSPGAAESRALGGLRDNKMLAKAEAEPPERILERIAALRREGRIKEADDLYAEFKRRFPDYPVPEAMREQVLPR